MELDGKDLSREPLEVRKATLASLLRARLPGLQFNQHLTHPGDIVFRHACAMGLEGIVSKRLGSRYRSGRSQGLAEVQEPGRAGGEARGRRGLGPRSVAYFVVTGPDIEPMTSRRGTRREIGAVSIFPAGQFTRFAPASARKVEAVYVQCVSATTNGDFVLRDKFAHLIGTDRA